MPFVQRVVEPKYVCRRRVWPQGGARENDESEAVVNVALSGTLRQLASLASHADALFRDLGAELDSVKDRTKALRNRMDRLEAKVVAFNPRTVAVPEGDINEFSQRKDHFVAIREVTTELFTPVSRPPAVQKLYEAAAVAAARAAASAAEAVAAAALATALSVSQSACFADDPSSVVAASHSLHTTTATIRNPASFGESSWSSAAASKILARAAKRLRNLDIETRTPASLAQLRRWTSTEALGSPTVTLGAPRIEHHRRTMPPQVTESEVRQHRSTTPVGGHSEEKLLDHRLPSPEEQVNAIAMRFQPEMVMVDVSGRGFDRMAHFRRSLTHVNCPAEEDGKKRSKRARRRKRRNTIAGTGDRELREALEADGPSTSAAAVLENAAASAGDAESTDILDVEVTSIGMSSSTSSAPPSAALDKKSHFENIRQWTRSKLRGSMAAVSRARSAGREQRNAESGEETNHYEVVRRRERSSTSLPISTLSGAMSMAVKLRQGAARRAAGGLTGNGGGSRSSPVKGQGSGDAAVNSSSGNWSGSSSARASLESEETASHHHNQQQHTPLPKVPTPVASLSTAPPSTTTSCSAATSSASSTASSSGGSSATNSLGRRDSASTASITGHSRRRHDSRTGPPSSSSSVPNSSSTARALSTSSEGTLTPDLVTIPFADDGETSSVYSCDTEGYYTSFHMDSGLKTLREEEAATVAALIANAGLGSCNGNGASVANNSSAIAENEYELFGKGSTSTTTSSAGTVCTTLMVRDRPAVPPRQSSLDSDVRQPSSRSVSSFDLDTIPTQTTITKAVVHAMPHEDGDDVDSGHNTTSSSSESSSPSSSPVDPSTATDSKVQNFGEINSNSAKGDSRWTSGWGECDYEFSESDLEGVERLERIRVKTTINSSRIPSMCVITPPQSDDEGGFGKFNSIPVYNTLPRSPSKKQVDFNAEFNTANNAHLGVKSVGSLDNLSRVVVSSITGSSKLQVINVSSSGYATVKTVEGKEGNNKVLKSNVEVVDNKKDINRKSNEVPTSSDVGKASSYHHPPLGAPLANPFNIVGMVKGVLSSAAGAVKSHGPVRSGPSSSETVLKKTSQSDYDRDGEYVTIAEIEKAHGRPGAPITTAKSIPAFREMEYVSLNELTMNPAINQQPTLQSDASSPASSLERNRRRQGARVTLDSDGRVVYSSDSLTRSWKNGKTATSTFEPGPHVKASSPTPASPLPNRIPMTNIRPVNSTSQGIPVSKPAVIPTSPVTSPTRLGRRLIIRPGNQLQSPVVEAVPTKAAVTALPGPVSPKLPHQGAYVNMQMRREQLCGGSPSLMRTLNAGGSWLQPAHMHPMQKQSSAPSTLQNSQINNRPSDHTNTMNQISPHSSIHQIDANQQMSQIHAYWTLPTRRLHSENKDSIPRSSTPNPRDISRAENNNLYSANSPTNKYSTMNKYAQQFFQRTPPNCVNPPYSGNIDRQQPHIVDPYCFKSSPVTNSHSHRWSIDSNHNVMHSSAPFSSTPSEKKISSLSRHFEGLSPIKNSTPTSLQNDKKNCNLPRKTLMTFSTQNGPMIKPPPNDAKLKDPLPSPLFTSKSTMPSDELFALIHRSKKKMNIRTDIDSPVRSSSPASHSSLSPGSSDSSLTGSLPSKTAGSRHSWSPQEGFSPSSPPSINGVRSGSRVSWAGNGCTPPTPPTSRTDFKRLLLQQRHGGGNRVSAAERLKVGKFGGTISNSPANSSPLPMNGIPRGLNLLPMNSVVASRNRIGSARRFASPRTDVLSSPIPEDKDGEELGNEQKAGVRKVMASISLQNGKVGDDMIKNSSIGKANNGSCTHAHNYQGFVGNESRNSHISPVLNKPQICMINDKNGSILGNHMAKSVLHSPSPTLGALLNKQRRQNGSPNSSLGPSVKSILEAIQVSKAKSSSKVALETAL